MNAHAPFTSDLHGSYADGVYALLQVLANPDQHRARLDELIAQEKAATEQIAKLNDMASETRRLHSAAQATNIVSDNRKKALDAREGEIGAELDQRRKVLEQDEAKRSDAALRGREFALSAGEEALKREETRVSALRIEYEAKLAKLSHLADALNQAR
jgi:hypothetical protein